MSNYKKSTQHNQDIEPRYIKPLINDGGGKRRGFGSLATAKIEENVLRKHEKIMELDDHGENIPCISESEIQESALEKERNRAKQMMLLLNNSDSNPFKKRKAGNLIDFTSVGEKNFIRHMEKVRNAAEEEEENAENSRHKDESASDSNGDDCNIMAFSEDDTSMINSSDTGAVTAPFLTGENCLDTQIQSSEQNNLIKQNIQKKSATNVNTTDSNELKNIFYRGGGVEWGNQKDISLENTVETNAQDNDALFRSAELFGYDIRTEHENAKKETFAFGFFEESNGENKADVTLNSDTSKASEQQGQKQNKANKKNETENTRPEINLKYFHLKLKPIPNVLEIFKLARAFSCTKTHEELVENWRNNKEKLTLDYKKKRKDALRNKKKKLESHKHSK